MCICVHRRLLAATSRGKMRFSHNSPYDVWPSVCFIFYAISLFNVLKWDRICVRFDTENKNPKKCNIFVFEKKNANFMCIYSLQYNSDRYRLMNESF